MDSINHDQQLLNIRQKYAQLSANNQKKYTEAAKNRKNDQLTNHREEFLYQTPIKNVRNLEKEKQNYSSNKQQENKTDFKENAKYIEGIRPMSLIKNSASTKYTAKLGLDSLSNRQMSQKLKNLDSKLQEKQKLLMQRVSHNERLLKESQQLRESQSRKSSLQGKDRQIERDIKLEAKLAFDKKQQYNLRLQKEKSFISLEGAQTERKNKEIPKSGKKTLENQIDKAKIKFQESMSSILKENINHRSKQQLQQKIIPQFQRGSLTERNFEPKQSKPKIEGLKVGWVFQNTTKIHERIQALLSSH